MFALIKRNTKIYFANKPGVIMSCFGALISDVYKRQLIAMANISFIMEMVAMVKNLGRKW